MFPSRLATLTLNGQSFRAVLPAHRLSPSKELGHLHSGTISKVLTRELELSHWRTHSKSRTKGLTDPTASSSQPWGWHLCSVTRTKPWLWAPRPRRAEALFPHITPFRRTSSRPPCVRGVTPTDCGHLAHLLLGYRGL